MVIKYLDAYNVIRNYEITGDEALTYLEEHCKHNINLLELIVDGKKLDIPHLLSVLIIM